MSNSYLKQREIGKGSFGITYEVMKQDIIQKANAKDESDHKYAMKEIILEQLDMQQKKEQDKEVEIMTSLDHINIIKLINYFEEPILNNQNEKKLFLIMDLADGNLSQLIDIWKQQKDWPNSTCDTIFDCFNQIMNGLDYYHQKSIIHRDIKPQNILYFKQGEQFDNLLIKICDFGISKQITKTFAKSKLQYNYMAPELIGSLNFNEKPYTIAVDIWAAGCVFYEMLTATIAFPGTDTKQQLQNIIDCIYLKTSIKNADAIEILDKMIIDVYGRSTSGQICTQLQKALKKIKYLKLSKENGELKLKILSCNTISIKKNRLKYQTYKMKYKNKENQQYKTK